ncbi:hypothetical protein CVT25_006140 [Psilocybe cyanescens]|uniref:Uncharacterized protein n=1 Tax=Psilocybe cyanescens TaxID=93625 RepID=A0A409WZ19_PSICY|nr:hypothetical protein CVT25_006140 [Psilocybe cyanescens]
MLVGREGEDEVPSEDSQREEDEARVDLRGPVLRMEQGPEVFSAVSSSLQVDLVSALKRVS